MKKFLFVIAATFLSALATTNGAHAQTTANISMPESSKDVAKLDNIKSMDNSDAAINSTINAKAIKILRKAIRLQATNNGSKPTMASMQGSNQKVLITLCTLLKKAIGPVH